MTSHPKNYNSNHFSTEKFPDVLAFCDRDESTHIKSQTEESYTYMLGDKPMYVLKKYASQWELIEFDNKKIVRVSTGKSLGLVLLQGLRFSDADKGKQEERVNIIFPVAKTEVEKTTAFMYYFGGYPSNFIEITPELALIIERFVSPDIIFFSYSYVPVQYLEWLREELKKAEILQDGTNKALWVYKK